MASSRSTSSRIWNIWMGKGRVKALGKSSTSRTYKVVFFSGKLASSSPLTYHKILMPSYSTVQSPRQGVHHGSLFLQRVGLLHKAGSLAQHDEFSENVYKDWENHRSSTVVTCCHYSDFSVLMTREFSSNVPCVSGVGLAQPCGFSRVPLHENSRHPHMTSLRGAVQVPHGIL